MIDGIVSGRLHGTATQRQGQNGSYVTCKVRAAVDGADALFVNVITFSTTVGDTLLALADGESVALAGALKPKAWADGRGAAKPALDMVAHAVLTSYHVQRRRKAVQAAGMQTDAATRQSGADDDGEKLDDDL